MLTGQNSGPTGLFALPSGIQVFPGTVNAQGETIRIGEAIDNGVDPSTTGLDRPVGSIVTSKNGSAAWQKTGTATTAWEVAGAGAAEAATALAAANAAQTTANAAGALALTADTAAAAAQATASGALVKSANLSDLASAAAARLNMAVLGAVFGPDMDCFSPVGTTWTMLPAQPGKAFMNATTPFYVIISKGGTLTTSPVFKCGTNGAHDNYSTLTPTTPANFNGAAVGYKAGFSTAVIAGVFQPCPDFGNPLIIELVTQAAGTGSPSLVIRPAFLYTAAAVP